MAEFRFPTAPELDEEFPRPGPFVRPYPKWMWDGEKWIWLRGKRPGEEIFSTGDVKMTMAVVPAEGWVLMNDGSIGSASSGATTRADDDTEDLFTLFFDKFADAIVQLQTSSGAVTYRANYSDDAEAAWLANCRIALPRVLGRALAGAGAGAGLTSRAHGSIAGADTNTMDSNTLTYHNHSLNGQAIGRSSNGLLGAVVGGILGIRSSSISIPGSGSSSPHNIMQPTTFMNVMVCL